MNKSPGCRENSIRSKQLNQEEKLFCKAKGVRGLKFLFPFSRKKKELADNEVVGNISDTLPNNSVRVQIKGIGSFTLDLSELRTTREDIYRDGQFSVFDILVGLMEKGHIELKYHFDESLNTHVVESIDGKENWWYTAYYDGGWPEKNVYRMDHYPYKDKMHLSFYPSSAKDINSIYDNFSKEGQKKQERKAVIVSDVLIRTKHDMMTFKNVEVSSHNTRNDLFQDGVVTALDVILSLTDDGKLTYGLKWHESIGRARVVKSYWVEKINEEQGYHSCGFVYEEGSSSFRHGRGNHIHIPCDARIINAPEYVEWFWICL